MAVGDSDSGFVEKRVSVICSQRSWSIAHRPNLHPATAHARQTKKLKPTRYRHPDGQATDGGASHSAVELARVSTPMNLFRWGARIEATPWDGTIFSTKVMLVWQLPRAKVRPPQGSISFRSFQRLVYRHESVPPE